MPANIILESEKTIGEVLLGLEAWLNESAFRVSGLSVDGTVVTAGELETIFEQNVESVETLDIQLSSWAVLALEALMRSRSEILQFLNSDSETQACIHKTWQRGSVFQFLAEQMPDIFAIVNQVLAGTTGESGAVLALIEERLQELTDPVAEFLQIKPQIDTAVKALENLPLDIQTGKDAQAAQTIQLFSQIAEKLLRLLFILQRQGLRLENSQLDEFASLLQELLQAYTVNDTVLVSDLAEYEIAPRLNQLYTTILNAISQEASTPPLTE
jgi:hypothetical protein